MREYFKYTDNFLVHSDVKSICKLGNNDEKVELTFIVPTYKRIFELRDCLDSLINQSERYSYRIVIVDNDSENLNKFSKVEETIKSFNSDKLVYYVNEKNIGAMGSWNRCIEIANSELVCMVHDDDVVSCDFLEKMLYAMYNDNSIDFLACEHKVFNLIENPKLDILDAINHIDIGNNEIEQINLNRFKKSFNSKLLGGIFKKDLAIRLGGFCDIDNTVFEDYIFSANYAFHYNFKKTTMKLYGYRIQSNDSLNLEMWQKETVDEYYFHKYIYELLAENVLSNLFLEIQTCKRIYVLNHAWSNWLGKKLDINHTYILNNTNIYVLRYIVIYLAMSIYYPIRHMNKFFKFIKKEKNSIEQGA